MSDQLILDNIDLPRAIARRFWWNALYDDLQAAATLGLVVAARKFVGETRKHFRGFAARIIWAELAVCFANYSNFTRHVSEETKALISYTSLDALPVACQDESNKSEAQVELSKILGNCGATDAQKRTWIMNRLLGFYDYEIAERENIGRPSVRDRCQAADRHIRKYVGVNYHFRNSELWGS